MVNFNKQLNQSHMVPFLAHNESCAAQHRSQVHIIEFLQNLIIYVVKLHLNNIKLFWESCCKVKLKIIIIAFSLNKSL